MLFHDADLQHNINSPLTKPEFETDDVSPHTVFFHTPLPPSHLHGKTRIREAPGDRASPRFVVGWEPQEPHTQRRESATRRLLMLSPEMSRQTNSRPVVPPAPLSPPLPRPGPAATPWGNSPTKGGPGRAPRPGGGVHGSSGPAPGSCPGEARVAGAGP